MPLLQQTLFVCSNPHCTWRHCGCMSEKLSGMHLQSLTTCVRTFQEREQTWLKISWAFENRQSLCFKYERWQTRWWKNMACQENQGIFDGTMLNEKDWVLNYVLLQLTIDAVCKKERVWHSWNRWILKTTKFLRRFPENSTIFGAESFYWC